MVLCCPHEYTNDAEHNCNKVGGKYGEEKFCPSTGGSGANNINLQEMNGLCTSSNTNDCGDSRTNRYSFEITCCSTEDVTVGPIAACGWWYGNYGDTLKCPKTYAVAGYCGSGGQADCIEGNAYTGIYCCPIKDNKS